MAKTKSGVAPIVQIGRTPQGGVVAETPAAIKPGVTSTWGMMYALLGDPTSRYGQLQVGDRISPTVKLQMISDPVIGFSLAFISAKLVRAEYEIQCADPEIQAFFKAMYAGFHREFMLQAAMAVAFGSAGLIKKLRFEMVRPLDVGEPAPWNYSTTPFICAGFDQVNPVGSWPDFDQDGRYAGFTYSKGKVDRLYSLWLTVGRAKAFGKYSGWGRLNNAYKSWWMGEFGYDQLAVHMQKFVDRVVEVSFPPGKDADGNDMSDTAITIGDQVRSGATVALPSNVYAVFDESLGMERLTAIRRWAVRFLENAENIDAFLGLADHLDARKAMAMLVPLQAYQQVKQSALGGPTTSDVLGELATEQLIEDASDLDMHVNEYLFPFLLRANFGPDAPPVTKVTVGLHQSDRGELFTLMAALVNRMDSTAAARIDVDELAHRLDVPIVPQEEAPAEPSPEIPPEAAPEESLPETAPRVFAISLDPYNPGHNGKLIDRQCPLEGCTGTQAVQFEDHGGLCVCTLCGKTYDPEIYP